jgi:ABC-type uncharacterized transport system permease subunit
MIRWAIATTKRMTTVLLVVWAIAATILALRLTQPGRASSLIADWPLWLSVPIVVVDVAVQFGSGAVALCLPIIGYALIVHGRPWRETLRPTSRARSRSTRPARSVATTSWEDTVLADTRITTKGVKA